MADEEELYDVADLAIQASHTELQAQKVTKPNTTTEPEVVTSPKAVEAVPTILSA